MSTNITEWYPKVRRDVSGAPNPLIKEAVIETLRAFCDYTGIWRDRLGAMDSVVVEAATDIAFVSGSPATITSTSTDFTSAGLASGDIIVTDHDTGEDDEANNLGPFLVDTVAANTLTLNSKEAVVSETAGDTTYISKQAYSLTAPTGSEIVEIERIRFDGKVVVPKDEEWLDHYMPYWRTEMSPQPMYYCMGPDRKIWFARAPQEVISRAIEIWVSLKPTLTATTVEDWLYNDWWEAIAFGAVSRLLRMRDKPWTNIQEAEYFSSLYEKVRNQAWHLAPKRLNRARRGMTA